MRRLSCFVGALLMLSGSVAPVAAEDNMLTAQEQFESMAWMAGHWRGEDFETYYTSPEGWLILSVSKQYSPDGAGVFGEFERFSIYDGVVTLTPFPGGTQSEHSFSLVACDPYRNRVEFENLEHDWPTHFLYESPDNDTLHIVVSGPDENGEDSFLEFNLKRVIDPPVVAKSE